MARGGVAAAGEASVLPTMTLTPTLTPTPSAADGAEAGGGGTLHGQRLFVSPVATARQVKLRPAGRGHRGTPAASLFFGAALPSDCHSPSFFNAEGGHPPTNGTWLPAVEDAHEWDRLHTAVVAERQRPPTNQPALAGVRDRLSALLGCEKEEKNSRKLKLARLLRFFMGKSESQSVSPPSSPVDAQVNAWHLRHPAPSPPPPQPLPPPHASPLPQHGIRSPFLPPRGASEALAARRRGAAGAAAAAARRGACGAVPPPRLATSPPAPATVAQGYGPTRPATPGAPAAHRCTPARDGLPISRQP